MREPIETKSRRYLAEGRLLVVRIADGEIEATCRGAGATYLVGFVPASGWRCSCPARGLCAHLTALQLVTTSSPGSGGAPESTR